MLREISDVAEPCSSTAAAIELVTLCTSSIVPTMAATREARGLADHLGGAPDQRADLAHRPGQLFGCTGNRLYVARCRLRDVLGRGGAVAGGGGHGRKIAGRLGHLTEIVAHRAEHA